MRYFGFPEDLIIKIKTLLNKPILNLLINDDICDPFQQADVGSGQGDPISAFLFCISIQPLLLRLAYDRVSYKDFEDFLHWKSIENVYFLIRKSIENAFPLMRNPLKILFQNWKSIENFIQILEIH